jgi:molybdopterin synthase sulfur carrier subunit
MRVNVLLFGTLRQTVGQDRLTLELPAQATVSQAIRALAEEHADIARLLDARQLAFAVNLSYCHPDDPLEDGDELAVIPPVSGG